MDTTKLKKLFIFASFFAITSLLMVLFQTDLLVIGNQVATEARVLKAVPVSLFATKSGYVKYVTEENDQEIIHPLLSSVDARLKIQRLGIEGKIYGGKDESTLDLGFWHFPSASPFSSKGNVVIIGHRFLKLPPYKDTFYHLNWVKVGDEIIIKTNEGTVTYKAREQKVVSNTDTYIIEQTINPQLTLITCHPLWTSAERLVIIADKIEENYGK